MSNSEPSAIVLQGIPCMCRDPRGKPSGCAAIPQGHPRVSRRNGLPGVGRFHGERTVGGSHDEAFARDELHNLVRVSHSAAEKMGATHAGGRRAPRRRKHSGHRSLITSGHLIHAEGVDMRIGILGSGLMGAKLGTIFARAGHDVVFSYSRSQRKLNRLARDAQKSARAGTPGEAALHADGCCWPCTGRASTPC